MPKERNKADGYREKAYEGDTKAMNNLGVCYERGTGAMSMAASTSASATITARAWSRMQSRPSSGT